MDALTKLPSTRREAAQTGLNRFYNGCPCSRGHNAPRFASTGACTACVAEDKKGKYKTRVKAYNKDYRRRLRGSRGLDYAKKMVKHWSKQVARLEREARS